MDNVIDLSVVIVNYNAKGVLRDCLLSLRKVEGVSFETFVVDNNSSDESADMVRSEFEEVKLVEPHENLGFSKGNNLAIKQSKGRYVLLLNPDTVVFPDTFKTMVTYMDTYSKIGASTCKVERANGELDRDCRRSFPTPWVSFCHFSGLEDLFPKSKIFARYYMSYLPENEVHEIESGVGAFLMVRREVLDGVGLLDEDYFFYGEDIDWCYRIKQAGWKITYNPHTKIIHYAGVSSGLKKSTKKMTTATRDSKLRVIKARFDAMKIFYQKHYRNKYPWILTELVLGAVETKRQISLLLFRLGR